MKKIAILLFVFYSYCAISGQKSYVDYVNPLVGTAPSTTNSSKHGKGTELLANVIPAVGVPFGMLQLTPQTRSSEKKCQAPYYYKDKNTSGYRLTHWLSGSCTQDYGSVTILPITGSPLMLLDHSKEVSKPFYYKNELGNVKTEMTATARSGMLQFTLLEDDKLTIAVTVNNDKNKGLVCVNPIKKEIIGYNPVYRLYQGKGQPAGFSGWFVIQYDTPMHYEKNKLCSSNNTNQRISIHRRAKQGETIKMRIGTSFTGLAGARKNLQAEINTWDFSRISRQAAKIWNKSLSQLAVESNNEKRKRIFYTAFYHSMQLPRLMNDVDGSYPRFASQYQSEKLTGRNYYGDFSMWDIYRAQLPLFEILRPDLINDFVNSMILKGQQGGWLPIFPAWNNYTGAMIGDHVIAFIASAYNKGIRNYDTQEAYRLMRKNAFDMADSKAYKQGKGRRALSSYLQYGYVPIEDDVLDAFHKKEQVSRTLEYAFDDYALATMAKDFSISDYTLLHNRSENYKHVFDKRFGMVNGRSIDGRFYKPFQPDSKLFFITEGTPRQYSFYVPHDINKLNALMGNLELALDNLFEHHEYWHGNEPSHHIPFLYNVTSSPYKAQKMVRQILNDEYSDDVGGISGNDDAGQMSAWYVFAAMGLYPVDPVNGQYMLTTPIFKQIRIEFPNGKIFEIKVQGKGTYIQSIALNGKSYLKNYLDHRVLMQGGVMVFNTSVVPVKRNLDS